MIELCLFCFVFFLEIFQFLDVRIFYLLYSLLCDRQDIRPRVRKRFLFFFNNFGHLLQWLRLNYFHMFWIFNRDMIFSLELFNCSNLADVPRQFLLIRLGFVQPEFMCDESRHFAKERLALFV